MSKFVSFTEEQMLQVLNRREGEEKWGEHIWFPQDAHWQTALQEYTGKVVILGIPEDIGVRANGGIGGAHTAWLSFLKSFTNQQFNRWNGHAQVAILGAFDFSEEMVQAQGATQKQLSHLVEKIDEEVQQVIHELVETGKVPIAIGGGHNNAYPIIKGVSKALKSPVNTINIDAHADLRDTTDRHSGNGFSSAMEEGYLERYFAIGLHEPYNNEHIWQQFSQNKRLAYCSFEDLCIRQALSLESVVKEAALHCATQKAGLEIDLDCIADVLSSATTPSGFSSTEVRRLLYLLMQQMQPAYIHICEGATQLSNGREDGTTGKLIAYMVGDIIKHITGFKAPEK